MTMLKFAAARLIVMLSALAPIACGGRATSEQSESNTNWLGSCDADSDCVSGLSCECGVCTRSCASLDCPRRLECTRECGGETAACQAQCDRDADCADLGNDAKCSHGLCSLDGEGLSARELASAAPSAEPDSGDVSQATERDAGNRDGDTSPAADGGSKGCRTAYVTYPVGATIIGDGCGREFTCQADGNFIGTFPPETPECYIDGPVQACSSMFPVLAPGQAPPSDPLNIARHRIDGNMLTLDYSFDGGCSAHDFGVCFELEGESYPQNVELYLIHDGHGDDCSTMHFTDTITFDLTPLAEAYRNANDSKGDIVQTNYGVYAFGDLTCDARVTGTSLELQAALDALPLACTANEDCTHVEIATDCYVGCTALTNKLGAQDFQASVDRINRDLCSNYATSGCGPILAPPCDDPGEPNCVDGECVDRQ